MPENAKERFLSHPSFNVSLCVIATQGLFPFLVVLPLQIANTSKSNKTINKNK